MFRYIAGTIDCFQVFVRLSEPMIFDSFVHPCKEPKKGSKLKKDTLCSFLNSSINIEFVFLILSGISQVMKKRALTRFLKSSNLRNSEQSEEYNVDNILMKNASIDWNVLASESNLDE